MPAPHSQGPDPLPGFGDNLRIRSTPQTESAGYAGLTGQVLGFTQPSILGETVVGELMEDFALNVYFEDRGEGAWFAPDLLEFVDHAPGSEFRVDGAAKAWIRTASGNWVEVTNPPAPRTWLQRLRGVFG